MSNIGYPVTSVHRTQKMLQYIEEATFGTHPTASPSLIDASVIRQYTINFNNTAEFYRRFGGRRLYKGLLLHRDAPWSGQFSPVDTAIPRYASEQGNTTGNLTGTLDMSLSFLNSWFQNSAGTLTEHFQFRDGTKLDSLTLNIARGVVETNFNAISRTVAKPITTADGGLTTPTYATPTTAAPWTHATGGASGQPLVIDSVNYPCYAFSVTVQNSMDAVQIDGSTFIEALEPTVKNVTVSFEVIVGKDLELDDDIETFVADGAAYQLNATGPKKINLTNLQMTNKTAEWGSGETTVDRMVFAGTAEDITIDS